MKWISPWVASQWLKWHSNGSSDMALANMLSIDIFGYPLVDNWFKWHFSDTVTLNWHSGTLLTNVRNLTFISGVGSSVVSLYRGKQSRSQPLRWSCNWVASQWLKWHWIGSSGMALMKWQSNGISWYPLVDNWFKWHFRDTVTLNWHSGTLLTNVRNLTFISGVVSLYRGKQPRS